MDIKLEAMYNWEKDVELLEVNGWVVESASPFEIRNE